MGTMPLLRRVETVGRSRGGCERATLLIRHECFFANPPLRGHLRSPDGGGFLNVARGTPRPPAAPDVDSLPDDGGRLDAATAADDVLVLSRTLPSVPVEPPEPKAKPGGLSRRRPSSSPDPAPPFPPFPPFPPPDLGRALLVPASAVARVPSSSAAARFRSRSSACSCASTAATAAATCSAIPPAPRAERGRPPRADGGLTIHRRRSSGVR